CTMNPSPLVAAGLFAATSGLGLMVQWAGQFVVAAVVFVGFVVLCVVVGCGVLLFFVCWVVCCGGCLFSGCGVLLCVWLLWWFGGWCVCGLGLLLVVGVCCVFVGVGGWGVFGGGVWGVVCGFLVFVGGCFGGGGGGVFGVVGCGGGV
ncbi:hypothetical protein, partial [Pseudomonas syringae group genomosp. 7]|uniref:hypothetical protein n=1 Tax=Pseudomonas syringae group genomosp. 7 TaxID=251699 RepID=UPI00376FB4EA